MTGKVVEESVPKERDFVGGRRTGGTYGTIEMVVKGEG